MEAAAAITTKLISMITEADCCCGVPDPAAAPPYQVRQPPPLKLVSRRNQLLKYLTREDRTRYQQIIGRLGLRK